MDLTVPQPKLMVRSATVCGKSRVAEVVQHVPKQGGKPRVVQPVAMEPSIGSKGGIGVVIVIPCSEKEGMKPPYMCPGCSNHTYSNNMITRFHVQ
jgi:hypothetical protein